MTDSNHSHGIFSTPPEDKLSRLPWLIAGVVILLIVVLLIAIGYTQKSSLPGPHAKLSSYASHLAISNIEMSQATSMVGEQSTYIDGSIDNKGKKTITGITVQVVFADFNNQPAQTAIVQMQRIRTRQPYIDTETLSAAPIAPGETVPFRLIFDHVTDDWNQNPPKLRIVGVKFQ